MGNCYKKKNKSIVIDNTNLKINIITEILNYFYNNSYTIQFKLFDCDLLEAKSRVIERDNYSLSFDENHVNICPAVDYIDKQALQYQSIKKMDIRNTS